MIPFLEKITDIGITDKLSIAEKKKLKFVNLILFLLLSIGIIGVILFSSLKEIDLVYLNLTVSIVIFLNIIIGFFKNYYLTIYSFFISTVLLLGGIAILYGEAVKFDFVLFITVFTPVFLYETRKEILTGIALLCVTFIIIQVSYYYDWSIYTIDNAGFAGLYTKICTIIVFVIELILFVEIQKQLELDKNNLMETVSERNRILEEFNYIIAHDLKAPLRNIVSFGKLLKKDPTNTEFLDYVNTSAQNMDLMFDDLLTYAKVGQNRKAESEVDLNDIIEIVHFNHQAVIQENKVTIHSKGDLPIIKANRQELTQLFQNLIGNAIKYQSTRDSVIDIAVKDRQKYIEVRVSDNGVGIAEDLLEDIFKPFLQSKKTNKGHGIGLAICKKVMKNLGGDVKINSMVDVGSTFILSFPKSIVISS